MYRFPENFCPDIPTYLSNGTYLSVSATGLDEPIAAPACLARSSISFIFFFSPIPLPADTTLSASTIGVLGSIPTVKSNPSDLSAETS